MREEDQHKERGGLWGNKGKERGGRGRRYY
jgi:hypothetical protein